MGRILAFISILTIGCSTKQNGTSDKTFPDLTQDEKTELLRGLGDDFKGDFLTYSGPATVRNSDGKITLDSLTFIELLMDLDKRFTIRTRFVESKIETDSMTIISHGGQSNKGIGKWSDLGNKFELQFQVGTVASFFDDEKNEDIEVIDKYTIHLDKAAEKIWIWKTLCKK